MLPDQLPVAGDGGVALDRHQMEACQVGDIVIVQLRAVFRPPAVSEVASACERLGPVAVAVGVVRHAQPGRFVADFRTITVEDASHIAQDDLFLIRRKEAEAVEIPGPEVVDIMSR